MERSIPRHHNQMAESRLNPGDDSSFHATVFLTMTDLAKLLNNFSFTVSISIRFADYHVKFFFCLKLCQVYPSDLFIPGKLCFALMLDTMTLGAATPRWSHPTVTVRFCITFPFHTIVPQHYRLLVSPTRLKNFTSIRTIPCTYPDIYASSIIRSHPPPPPHTF